MQFVCRQCGPVDMDEVQYNADVRVTRSSDIVGIDEEDGLVFIKVEYVREEDYDTTQEYFDHYKGCGTVVDLKNDDGTFPHYETE